MITVEFEGSEGAARLFERKARYVGSFIVRSGRAMMGEVKADIREEISGQKYLADGRGWPRTKPFGRLAGGRPALRSYAGKWSSAPVRLSAAEAEISITAPGAHAHGGGRGLQRRRLTTIIRARGNPRAMQGAIYRKTGARVSRRTLAGIGLRLESRPHGNPDNPQTISRVEAVMARDFERA